jgi:hypothetical protein
MNAKLAPTYNLYQYLVIFLVGGVVDTIIHIFSRMKYNGLINKTNSIGIAPELMLWYKSLKSKGPLGETMNQWVLPPIIAGTLCVIILLLTDLVLQLIEWRTNQVS